MPCNVIPYNRLATAKPGTGSFLTHLVQHTMNLKMVPDVCRVCLKGYGTSRGDVALVGCRGDRVGLQKAKVSMYPLLKLSNTYRPLPLEWSQVQGTQGQVWEDGGL